MAGKVAAMQPTIAPERPSSRRQQLLNENSWWILVYSVSSFLKAAVHPYVRQKFTQFATPVLIATTVVYVVGLLLFMPLELVARLVGVLSLGTVSSGTMSRHFRSWLRDSVALVPFLSILLLRQGIRKPLYKCFIHLLREINPEAAAAIESGPSQQRERSSGRRGGKGVRMVQKVIALVALELGLHVARKFPLLGRPAVVASHFLTMKQIMGRDRAISLSLLGLVPKVEPWLLHLVQFWRASSLLGQELLIDYIKIIPPSNRTAFFKAHDVTIPLFVLPQMLLLQIPFAGPLAFIPMQAAAAFLVDMVARGLDAREAVQRSQPQLGSMRSSTGSIPNSESTAAAPAQSPTLPSGPPPMSSAKLQSKPMLSEVQFARNPKQ